MTPFTRYAERHETELGWVGIALALVVCGTAACESARAVPSEQGAKPALERPRAAERPRTAERADAALSRASNVPPPMIQGCPKEMARIGDYCVDRYEAHLVVRVDDRLVAHSPYERPPSSEYIVAQSEPGVVPQGYVSRNEAAVACEHAAKRLCSVKEWYRACQSAGGGRYPYGDKYEHHRCNSGKIHLLSRLFGANSRNWSYEHHFNSPKLNQEPGFLAKTGEYSDCKAEHGVHDMVGNLHEWVRDSVSEDLPRQIPLAAKLRPTVSRHSGKGVFAGGFYGTLFEHGSGCAFVTLAHEPSYHDYSTGFRCCRDSAD